MSDAEPFLSDTTFRDFLRSRYSFMTRLHSRIIVVSGGGSSFGRAIVEHCLEAGARVTVLEAESELAAQLRGDFGTELIVVCGDPTQLASHRQALAATLQRHHRVDGFVAHSACWDHGLALADLPDDDTLITGFDQIFAANVRAYLCGARVMAAPLRRSQGSMVFTLSSAAIQAGRGGALSTAAHHAGAGLVRQLALELAPAVRVNGVCAALPPRDRHGPFAARAAKGQRSDAVGAPRYLPDPRSQTEHYLALLAPHDLSAATGALLEVDAEPGLEGLITLS